MLPTFQVQQSLTTGQFAETECSNVMEECRFSHEVARASYLQYSRVLGNGIRIIKVMLEKTRESLWSTFNIVKLQSNVNET